MSAVIMDHGETSTRMDIEVARGFDNNPMLSPLKNQNQDGSGGFFGSGFDYGKLNNNNNRKMSSSEKDISPDEIVLNTGAKFEIGPHLETFSKAVMALAKISESLILVPTREGLHLRAINDTKSAVAIIYFATTFFSDYDVSQIDSDENAKNYVKISMRAAMDLFKRHKKIGDTNISCILRIDPKVDYMVVDFWQTSDCAKSVKISLRDCNPQKEFGSMKDDKNDSSNYIRIPAKTLINYLDQMGKDTDDIIIKAMGDEFSITKYIPEERDKKKEKKTEAKLETSLFEEYQIPRPTTLMINTKYLRPILILADHLAISVSLHFDEPGVPIIVSLENNIDFTADFILATTDADERGDAGSITTVAAALAKEARKTNSSQNSLSSSHTQRVQPPKSAQRLARVRIQSESPIRVTQFAEKLPPTAPMSMAASPQEIQELQQENLDPVFQTTQIPPYDRSERDNQINEYFFQTPQALQKERQPNFEADFTPSPEPAKRFKHYFLSVSQVTLDKHDLFNDEEVIIYDSDKEDE
uniref:Uncharacterized protein n=1 Tax=Acrobeloides nanus TaxID=290746 RepID=A0A914EGN4_9BILA